VEAKRKRENMKMLSYAWKRDSPTLVYWLVFLDDVTRGTASKTPFGFKKWLPES